MNAPKMMKIIYEPAYEESIGCKQLISSLTRVFKRKRLDFEIVQNADLVQNADDIYLIGQSKEWIDSVIARCNGYGHTPVLLSDQPKKELSGSCHLICPDIGKMLMELKEQLQDAGRRTTALYGINLMAEADKRRAEALLGLAFDVESIYQSSGNLENCFRSFLPKADYYDAVICVNGYAAISLVKRLEKECPEILETLVVLSFEEVLRHSKYNRWISLIDLQLDSYGPAALAVSELAHQKMEISNITIEMSVQLCEIPCKSPAKLSKEISEGIKPFEDPEIIRMAKIEQLFRDADDLDHHIIAMLLENAKYGEIADSCYMTEGNVKYRVKKYLSICGCKGKKELLELLQEYLQ